MRSTTALVGSRLITVAVVPRNERAMKGVAHNGTARLQPQGDKKAKCLELRTGERKYLYCCGKRKDC
jgi:hypothetical protein